MIKNLLVVLLLCFSVVVNAQLADGSTAPDFTLLDLEGNEHNLYSYLDQDITVFIDFSAVWCGPCWNYHTSGALEQLYEMYGPDGTGEVMVFFIEGDQGTIDEINGNGANTLGDWTAGTAYPIIPTVDPNNNQVSLDYQIAYWPTLYKICPDKIITEVGQLPTEDLYASSTECPSIFAGINLEDGTSNYLEGMPESESTVNCQLATTLELEEEFNISLSIDAPADWSGTFDLDGETYETEASVTLVDGSEQTLSLNYLTGQTPGVGAFTLYLQSVNNPSYDQYLTVNVISGVTDLIVSNSNGLGDGSGGDASNWESDFISGLSSAGNNAFATTDEMVLSGFIQEGALSQVNNVYYNVGWTFPSLTDELVGHLSSFLDNGGNLFISGQDIGWEIMDPGGYGTAQTQAFYTNYLQTNYLSDGDSSTDTLYFENTGDPVFSNVNQVAIVTDFYGYPDGGGAPHMYAEQIAPATESAHIIMQYIKPSPSPFLDPDTITAGVRVETESFKVVYLGVGVEMFADNGVKDKVLQLSHDWFYGNISTDVFELQMNQLYEVTTFPNPSSDIVTLEYGNSDVNVLNIYDVQGKLVFSKKLDSELGLVTFSASQIGLKSGSYICNLSGSQSTSTTKIDIIR